MNSGLHLRGLLAVALLVALGASSAGARVLPAWSPSGTYQLSIDPGFVSVAGNFTLPIGDGPATLSLHYDDAGDLTGAGLSENLTLFSLVGTFSVDGVTHEQRVHLADPAKEPKFTFDGVVSADGNEIVGSYTKKAGYLDYPGDETGPLTIRRTAAGTQTRFTLSLATRMDERGKIRGKLAADGRTTTTAQVALYDGRVVSGGKISGRVKTDKNLVTTGKLKIKGRKWFVKLAGPIDQSGFYATGELVAAGFEASAFAVTMFVQPGPEPSNGKPPKPPANLLAEATAAIANGQITILHPSVPRKFFGKTSGISLVFSLADGIASVPADVSTNATASPRRFVATVGNKTFSTATSPIGNGVLLGIRKLSTIRGGLIEVLVTGSVISGSKLKSVDVLVQAAVQ